MSRFTRYLLLMLVVIVVACFLQWKTCCNGVGTTSTNNDSETNEQIVVEGNNEKIIKNPFNLKDTDGSLSLESAENFNFKASNHNFISPLSLPIDTNIDKLKEYLNNNKNKALNIVGFYTTNEKNETVFPNLGEARANSIKNYLASKGILSKIMNTSGTLKDDLIPSVDENIFYGPVSFELTNALENNDEKMVELLTEIQKDPLTVHFKKGQTYVNLTTEQRIKFSKISKYLDKVENAKCLVIGHTDNSGNPQGNMGIGEKRANFAKGYLVKNAIPESKIEAISKGQNEPVATNKTKEGQAQNRRTVITIK